MRDYAELIKALRFAFDQPCCSCVLGEKCNWGDFCFFKRAADAIEDLLAEVDHLRLKMSAYETDNQYMIDENRKLVNSLMNLCFQKWISVEERLPEVGIDVLVTDGSDVCISHQVRYVSPTERFTFWSRDDLDLTHWMPLPEAPKEETE